LENKNTEINKLLIKLSRESVRNYKLVDFWEADTTTIGSQIENALIYVSAFNYDRTHKYNVIIEKYDTGEIIEEEEESTYDELINLIHKIKE